MTVRDELRQYDAFRALSAAGWQLLSGCRVSNTGRERTILHKGQPVSGAYIVVSGQLRVYSITADGTELTLYFLSPGETCVLALNCLFNDLRYPAWVQPVGEAKVVVIPGEVYRALFEQEAGIRELTVRTLSTLVFRLMAELESAVSQSQGQRLAQFLLEHSASDGVLRATQHQLAQHLGTSREVVARLLGQFAAEGLVATARGAVTLRDLEGLRRRLLAEDVQ